MSMRVWDFVVTYGPPAAGRTIERITITDDVIGIPVFTDTGSGDVNSARMRLDARNGKFLTMDPVLQRYGQIRITATHVRDAATDRYDKIFEIMKIIPVRDDAGGTVVELMLLGQEHNLQKINYARTHWWSGAREVVNDMIDVYNQNRGESQPQLTSLVSLISKKGSGNFLPDSSFQVSIYEYGVNEDNIYDRIRETVDKLGSSVDLGGALDYYDFRFDNDVAPGNLNMRLFSSGSKVLQNGNVDPLGSQVVLMDAEDVNTGENEGGIDTERATLVSAWGANDQGTLPVDQSRYSSREQRFALFPAWNDMVQYEIGSRVRSKAFAYVAVERPTKGERPVNGNIWHEINANDYYRDLIQYSPWTVDRAVFWRNAGAGQNGMGDDYEPIPNVRGKGCFDGSTVINDAPNGFTSTKVDTVVTDPADISDRLLYSGTGNRVATFYPYRGLRILVNGNPGGVLADDLYGTGEGNDINGRPYKDSVVMHVGNYGGDSGITGEWRVLYEARENSYCCVIDDMKVLRYDGMAWVDVDQNVFTTSPIFPFHPYDSIENAEGSLNQGGVLNGTTNEKSAIMARYQYSVTPQLTPNSESDYRKVGAWLNFRFPFPISRYDNDAGEAVGHFYGGVFNYDDPTDYRVDREPATLEQQNMFASHDGYRGFNNGASSEDLGQINAIAFDMKIHTQASLLVSAIPLWNVVAGIWNTLAGEEQLMIRDTMYYTTDAHNFNMRCIIEDTNDNQVFQDFVLPFNNHWTSITLPIGSFQVFRARQPLNHPTHAVVPLKEIEALNIFEWRNIKNIIFLTQDSYDGENRYNPTTFNPNIGKFIGLENFIQLDGVFGQIPGPAGFNRRNDLYIDNFRFIKPLLVNTGRPTATVAGGITLTTRTIEEDFLQRPDIGNYDQLKSDAYAELERARFPHVEFTITTEGRFDIRFGEYFWYRTSNLIPQEYWSDDAPGVELINGKNRNTIKLVAKKIEYSITNAKNSKGGLLRTITGVRRFE